ncbi:Protein Iojap, chloroplastic [Morella rubra]|uniref:Protein Iojap, chloroplastic n=1 Tax=Morella rubra TaxID=262757 RepID=A0A6A1VSP9_9ROSI|nr:Protein Iojap, chloroplastic [Morella rubra]
MSVSIVQFTASCSSGTQFSGEFQRLGRVGSKVSERPKKLFGCSCMNWHHFPLNDCIWRIPGSRNFNVKSRNSSLVLAIGKELPFWMLRGNRENEVVSAASEDKTLPSSSIWILSKYEAPSKQPYDRSFWVKARLCISGWFWVISETVSFGREQRTSPTKPKPDKRSFCWRYYRKSVKKYKMEIVPNASATGRNNVSEDADDMCDDLFNKFGKIVFKRTDQKPLSAEVDDDAESLSFAVAMAKVASDVKAADIRVLFVKPLVYWTRFFIIVTAFSRPQIDAIAYGSNFDNGLHIFGWID